MAAFSQNWILFDYTLGNLSELLLREQAKNEIRNQKICGKKLKKIKKNLEEITFVVKTPTILAKHTQYWKQNVAYKDPRFM